MIGGNPPSCWSKTSLMAAILTTFSTSSPPSHEAMPFDKRPTALPDVAPHGRCCSMHFICSLPKACRTVEAPALSSNTTVVVSKRGRLAMCLTWQPSGLSLINWHASANTRIHIVTGRLRTWSPSAFFRLES